MKKTLLILSLIFYLVSYSQTKKETYDYINQKIEQHKLEDATTSYAFLFQEVEMGNSKYINLIEICTLFSRCSTAYLFKPNDYSSIIIKEKEETIWLEIYCKYNSIQTQEIDLNTRERFKSKDVSKITLILEKNTPKKEINRIKIAFRHLLKLYGVEKKDLFDE